jgi:threonine aldolase
MKLDLRSDTITKPSSQMIEAMMSAEVGDDVFGDDPTVKALEQQVAQMFGMEASLFCTSGTLTNQLAIKTHCKPGSEIICDKLSHIYLYEGGGVAINALSSLKLLDGNMGRIDADLVKDAINNPLDIHLPLTRLVSVENTMNKGGGVFYDFNELMKIREVCDINKINFHLDGARLFNALVETKETTDDYGKIFDSISICLSKGLGCPVGSLLLGSHDFIQQARRSRKAMGGGWRQAGFLAAAGIYALDNNVERLREDHKRASSIVEIIKDKSFVKSIFPVNTNIVIFELPSTILATEFVAKAEKENIYCVPFGKHLVRFVTHLNFSDDSLQQFQIAIKKIEF